MDISTFADQTSEAPVEETVAPVVEQKQEEAPKKKAYKKNGKKRERLSDAIVARAAGNEGLIRAMNFTGVVDANGVITCPTAECRCNNQKKVMVRQSKNDSYYLRCFKCSGYWTSHDLLRLAIPDLNYRQEVFLLSGAVEPRKFGIDAEAVSKEMVESLPQAVAPFSATVESEIYEAILNSRYTSVEEAIAFWARRGISEEAVRTHRSVMVTDAMALGLELIEEFGKSQLVSSGVFLEIDAQTGGAKRDILGHGIRPLFSNDFAIVEPTLARNGIAREVRFRASSAKALARIKSFEGGKMFVHVQYHVIETRLGQFKLHQRQLYLRDKDVNVTHLYVDKLTEPYEKGYSMKTKDIGEVYVDTDKFLKALKKVNVIGRAS